MSHRMDALATIGNVLAPNMQGRDAVHVAVIVAVAGEDIWPADCVALHHSEQPPTAMRGGYSISSARREDVGIADPFLECEKVQEGERFWVFVYPRTITGLSHHWTHPDIPEPETPSPGPGWMRACTPAASEAWVRDWCDRHDFPSFETLAMALKSGPNGWPRVDFEDDCFTLVSDSSHYDDDVPPEFWDHVENALGIKIPMKPTYWRCAC